MMNSKFKKALIEEPFEFYILHFELKSIFARKKNESYYL